MNLAPRDGVKKNLPRWHLVRVQRTGTSHDTPPEIKETPFGAHNVYYVKSCLSDAKCFSGSRYSFRVQELKPLLFHNWPVHGEIAWLFPAPC